MLGTKQNAGWLDLSDYLVHFTKGTEGQNPYLTVMSILSQQVLRRGTKPFGAAMKVQAVAESQRVVCFSEVPIGYLSRIALRRESAYGVGFTKRFILDLGGAPLWYLEQGTAPAQAFRTMVDNAKHTTKANDPIWKLTPLVDFASGPDSIFTYDFRWEREWRIVKEVHFKPEDVAFLLIPKDSHAAARTFFNDAEAEHSGPSYSCPFIDPSWSVDEVKEALSSGGPSAK